jgi:predicted nucleotidyltransferase
MSKNKVKKAVLNALQDSDFKKDIKKVSLFGSHLTETATPTSDVDLLVSFMPNAIVGFSKLSRIKFDLETKTGLKVDLVTPDALSKYFKNDILKNSEKIYEG